MSNINIYWETNKYRDIDSDLSWFIMKIRGGIVFGIILLFVGLSISPATGGILEAEDNQISTQEETIDIYFWDITGPRATKQIIELTESEWYNLRLELREVRANSDSKEELLGNQIEIFKEYDLVSDDVSYEDLQKNGYKKLENRPVRKSRASPLENVIFNMICAISFELETGNNLVFGLNTFVNIIGFDIVSVHKGYSPDGISTLGGLLAQSNEPGNYTGFMFGFFGYWMGTKTGTGTYSDLIAAGFTVTTAWIPLP
jgi:hypothetical protein